MLLLRNGNLKESERKGERTSRVLREEPTSSRTVYILVDVRGQRTEASIFTRKRWVDIDSNPVDRIPEKYRNMPGYCYNAVRPFDVRLRGRPFDSLSI